MSILKVYFKIPTDLNLRSKGMKKIQATEEFIKHKYWVYGWMASNHLCMGVGGHYSDQTRHIFFCLRGLFTPLS